MATITINLADETERQFRKNVMLKFGKKKGALGKALEEALRKWNTEQSDTEHTLELLDKKIDRGGYTYEDRAELHLRR